MVKVKTTPRLPKARTEELDESAATTSRKKKKDEVEDAVKYFANSSSSTKVRGNLQLSLALTTLEETGRASGFASQHIRQLIKVAASARFPVTVSSRLVKCLLPENTIPAGAVLTAISRMCTNVPSTQLQAVLLKWIILTYDLIEPEGGSKLHALYGVIFQFIENNTLCPLVCHLLYLLTMKDDVVRFRVQRLLHLQRRVGVQSHITALLAIYKLYRPDLVSVVIPTNQRVYFRQMESIWRAQVRAAKDRIAAAGRLDDSVFERLHGTLNETGPVTKRQRLEVVPRVMQSSSIHEARYGSHGDLTRVQIHDINSFEDLLENIDRVELPSQAASVLRSPFLQHVVTVRRPKNYMQRLNFWLYQVLQETLDDDYGESRRGEELLQLVINFNDFLQENVSSCENWLINYLRTWNGLDYRPLILRIVARCRLQSFHNLNALILEPLRSQFFSSSVFFKCQLVFCFTELLRNYVTIELPRCKQHLGTKQANQSEADITDIVIDSHMDQSDALETIEEFISAVDEMFAVGLLHERDNVLLMHFVLNFYELVSEMHTKHKLPFTRLPSPAIVYRAIFGSSSMMCSRMCSIITRYRDELSSLKQNNEALGINMSDLSKHVNILNGYILDISNTVWRNKAFTTNKAPSVYEGLTDVAKTVEVPHPNEIFSLYHHLALVGYARRFLIETQPEGKRVHPGLIHGDHRDAYLEFLKTERIDGVVNFIATFIKRSTTNK